MLKTKLKLNNKPNTKYILNNHYILYNKVFINFT